MSQTTKGQSGGSSSKVDEKDEHYFDLIHKKEFDLIDEKEFDLEFIA